MRPPDRRVGALQAELSRPTLAVSLFLSISLFGGGGGGRQSEVIQPYTAL